MDKRQKRAQKAKKRQEALRKARAAPGMLDQEAVDEASGRARRALEGGDPTKALRILRRALRAAPGHPTLLTNMVVVLEGQGQHGEALATSRLCVEANPEFAQAHKDLSTLLKFEGDLEGARRCLRRAIELAPEHGEAWRSLAGIKRFRDPTDPDIATLRALLEGLPSGRTDRGPLHFALAKALEDVGAYDESFEHYALGNRRMRSGIHYRTQNMRALVDATIENQGQAFLSVDGASEGSGDAPILIVGMPRSGSTLVEQILASHPEVVGVGEVPDLTETLAKLGQDPHKRASVIAGLDERRLVSLGAEYAARLRRRAPDANRVVDKNLENFLHVGFLARALPEARIVHAVRNPIDNCLACFKVLFTSNLPFTYDLTELGEYYQLLERLMAHWHALLPGRVLDVHYEKLVTDQEGESRRLLEFCGLPWDEACLRFHETDRRVTSASTTQVRSPIYTSSLEKWRLFDSHLGPLRDSLGRQ